MLFLKIIATNVSSCCTVNLSRHIYLLANKNLLSYRCRFVYITKRTLRGEPEGAGITINRGKVVFFQTGTEPSYIMYTYVVVQKEINPQTEINTRRAFLDTIVFALLFLQKYMILLYYK